MNKVIRAKKRGKGARSCKKEKKKDRRIRGGDESYPDGELGSTEAGRNSLGTTKGVRNLFIWATRFSLPDDHLTSPRVRLVRRVLLNDREREQMCEGDAPPALEIIVGMKERRKKTEEETVAVSICFPRKKVLNTGALVCLTGQTNLFIALSPLLFLAALSAEKISFLFLSSLK